MATIVSSSTDPSSLLNTQLASALSTLGDAQFWEETISPSTIRNELSSSDPSNPNSTPTLLKGMKWLLASISKGRDVSDFYPHVVKLVGATSLEVRKMVYMYLVQYADHDATTRELSLLSINSFQRGLADSEQLIRALALRVLSSIRIADILQIQILGVQKCAKDHSPYVRKCAANALSKLAPRCSMENDVMQKDMLMDIMVEFLNTDTSTMVLSSALIAFCELCPNRLELLHGSYRKICHLLTDMDEWGQVAILDLLSRYCRKFFKEPKGWKHGTAEKIDRERRVRRTVDGFTHQGGTSSLLLLGDDASATTTTTTTTTTTASYSTGLFSDMAPPASSTQKLVKRRVIQKGFYSDEEDESGDEEVLEEETPLTTRNILGLPGIAPPPNITINKDAEEDMDLDEDHRLLLQSAMPLLKSRNAGVVLGVCSLLYYCGVSSVKTRSAIGKALVRIHRGRREIQYVVLTSIRTLVKDCPSAFAPFLNDFFVKALDPPPTRIIKVDILVSLALEPAAIEAVLKELRTYIRSGDKTFVRAAIRAVGRVAELARIVYDRHGQKSGNDAVQERKTANRIALDCLYGLAVVTQTGDSKVVIGEAICVIQSILTILRSDARDDSGAAGLHTVEDPNHVQSFAFRRTLLLLVNTLSNRRRASQCSDQDDHEADNDEEPTDLEKLASDLPEQAVAAALWTVGEWFTSSSPTPWSKVDETTKSKMRFEIIRLVDQTFPEMSLSEKCQAIHLSTKLLLLSGGNGDAPICEHILSMGRIDVHPDVKDCARMESGIIQASIRLNYDKDNLDAAPAMGTKLTLETAKRLLLSKKPAPSFLAVDDETQVDMTLFRFGSLSSLVGHQARGTYLPLPSWNDKNSPKALRDPIDVVKQQVSGVPATAAAKNTTATCFYRQGESSSSSESSGDDDDSSSNDDSSSSDDTSSSESSDEKNNADGESDSDSDDDESSSGDDNDSKFMTARPNNVMGGGDMATNTNIMNNYSQSNTTTGFNQFVPQPMVASTTGEQMASNPNRIMLGTSNSSDEDSSSSSSSSSDDDYQGDESSSNNARMPSQEGNLLSMGYQGGTSAFGPGATVMGASTVMDDLRGLVMAPIAMDESKFSDPDAERDSSAWTQLVRPAVGGGLSAKIRFLRGPTKVRESQLKGLDPKLPNVVCVEMQFRNKKADTNALRRIRILPKSSSGGGVQVKKALCPPEIAELKVGQLANATLCLEFATASNRGGDMVARFDIKTSTGGAIPIEIKPSLGDLLLPKTAPSIADFDTSMNRMQGFQRVSSNFKSSNLDAVPLMILKSAALTPVGQLGWQENRLRLIGGLPASDDLVFVRVDCDRTSGGGMITVCCDDAMAVNSIMAVLKNSLSHQ